MSVENIVQQIDKEISNLTQARNVLAGLNGASASSVASGGRFSAASRAKMAAAQPVGQSIVPTGVKLKQPNPFVS